MTRATTIKAALVTCVLLIAGPAAAKGGFYIGLGLGGAVVSGERGVPLNATSKDGRVTLQIPAGAGNDAVRTDLADGLATMFRFGYNILGAVAIEAAFVGQLSNFSDSIEAAGHLCFDAMIHPLGIAELAGAMEETMWDPYVIIGGGFTYALYTTPDGQDKGWKGGTVQTGAGMNMHLLPFFSLGIDLRVTMPLYDTWYFNFDRDESFEPLSTPSTIIFTPQLLGTFHFG